MAKSLNKPKKRIRLNMSDENDMKVSNQEIDAKDSASIERF